MYLSAGAAVNNWPETVLILGSSALGLLFLMFVAATVHEFRKTQLTTAQGEEVRQLVRRYEQLAESTLDAQQRLVADTAELRARTTAIEQILRTVE